MRCALSIRVVDGKEGRGTESAPSNAPSSSLKSTENHSRPWGRRPAAAAPAAPLAAVADAASRVASACKVVDTEAMERTCGAERTGADRRGVAAVSGFERTRNQFRVARRGGEAAEGRRWRLEESSLFVAAGAAWEEEDRRPLGPLRVRSLVRAVNVVVKRVGDIEPARWWVGGKMLPLCLFQHHRQEAVARRQSVLASLAESHDLELVFRRQCGQEERRKASLCRSPARTVWARQRGCKRGTCTSFRIRLAG